MQKPIKPIAPLAGDIKYKQDRPTDYDTKFVIDYKKWQKDMKKYEADLELWEQTKFIEDVKRSTLKLCLKKYKITKK